jgi:hypothetical protein
MNECLLAACFGLKLKLNSKTHLNLSSAGLSSIRDLIKTFVSKQDAAADRWATAQSVEICNADDGGRFPLQSTLHRPW